MSKCVCGHEDASHTSANDGACTVLEASGGECSCLKFVEPTPSPAAGSELKDEIFRYLNCYEVSASEVNDGMTYIDSSEAEKMSDELMHLIAAQNNATYEAVMEAIGHSTQTFQSDTGLSDFAAADLGIALTDLRNWVNMGQEVGRKEFDDFVTKLVNRVQSDLITKGESQLRADLRQSIGKIFGKEYGMNRKLCPICGELGHTQSKCPHK